VSKQPLRVSFDIGGVLSKYPDRFRRLVNALSACPDVELYVITDMHDHAQSVRFVHGNGFEAISADRILNSDYQEHGEECKRRIIEERGIDFHFDDFPGYCAHTSCVSLFVWPNPAEPYYADDWQTDGSEGGFGRRCRSQRSQEQ
jgi:hypothetical protein